MKNVEHMICPYDDRGRLVGEDVWEIDESKREVVKVDPAEVLTPEEGARLLEPYMKPLPAFGSVAAERAPSGRDRDTPRTLFASAASKAGSR